MYRKKCPECGEYSYSSSIGNLWRCATCKSDIVNVKPELAGAKEEKQSDKN
jgi:ribosomal protein L37AE/L43A